jgi:hypothetical protein
MQIVVRARGAVSRSIASRFAHERTWECDLASGRRTPALTIRAHDAAGLRLTAFAVSHDAKYYVHTYARMLSDLYVIDGLK